MGLVLLVGLQPVAAQTNPPAVSTRQALRHLTDLIDVYQVELASQQQASVVSVCRTLQASTLQDLRMNLGDLQQKYLNSIDAVSSNLSFVADALSRMGEDASSINLASFHLSLARDDFVDSATIYGNSLDELLIIDCQSYPVSFVAGLKEVRVRRQSTYLAAEELSELITGSIDQALSLVRQRLEAIQ